MSFNAEWIKSSGKYKFRYQKVNPLTHEIAYDTTAVRHNGDINATRLEGNLHIGLPDGQMLVKVYNYNSERGIPGAIVNNVWRRGERLWDNNSFVPTSSSSTTAYDYMPSPSMPTIRPTSCATRRQQPSRWTTFTSSRSYTARSPQPSN